MNKNILIALIAVVVLAGGFVMVKNSSKPQPADTTTQTSNTPTDVMEKSPTEEPNAMMEQKVTTVTLNESGFEPANITIKKGDKVVWENKSGDTATVDSDNHPTHLLYAPLNLGAFQDGEKHELIFDKVGKYTYHDHFHPSRRGTVVVE